VKKKQEQQFRPQTTKAISGKIEKLNAEIAKIYAESQFQKLNQDGEHGALKRLASGVR
jgi:hypothetical protein